MITFNADEIFEMAQQIERNGAAFYRRVAQGPVTAKLKGILLDLATMEDQHEKRFGEMRQHLDEDDRTSTVFDPEGEAALYLRAMADTKVFDLTADPARLLTGKETAEQVIRTAIGMEKDSIVFYLGMRDLVSSSRGKGRIEAIIREEMSHITTLSKVLGDVVILGKA